MQEGKEFPEFKYSLIGRYDARALEDPEFQKFVKEGFKSIGRFIKRVFKALGSILGVISRYLVKQSQEGARIHNQVSQNLDERYAKNAYHIRSSL